MSDSADPTTPAPAPKPKRNVTPLPIKRELKPWDLESLRASGLDDESLRLAQLYTETNRRAIAQLMGRAFYPECGAALVIPFIEPGTADPYAYRIRPSKPRIGARGKPVKYDQAANTPLLVYWPPRLRVSGELQGLSAMLWTEGEKKALALDQLGYACIGLTGVHNWHDPAHKDQHGVYVLHPTLAKHARVAGRQHVIVFDADSHDNDQVMTAAQRLAGVLLAAGATAVRFVCPPSKAHKGIDDHLGAHGADAVRALIAAAGPIDALAPDALSPLLCRLRAFADAPLDRSLRLPEGYDVQRDGSVWRRPRTAKGDAALVTHRPVAIGRYLTDAHTREGRAELVYWDESHWQTLTVSRTALADSRTLVKEAATYGCPVSSQSAPRVVEWLDAYHAANDNRIPRVDCVARTGWHDVDGARVFVADRVLAAEGTTPTLTIDARGDRKRMFAVLAARGTTAGHVAALKRAFAADPSAAAVICAAVAAPLLEPLGAANFAVHLPGDSSRGKTSKLKCAASIFGNPHSDWVANWNASPAAVEFRAATYDHLPQCYDELGSADVSVIEKLVYMLVNGGGRARGQKDMTLRESPSWHCTVLSTGERELADETAATGAQVRVLQLPAAGFGDLDAAAVDDVREACADNAGSLGAELLQVLVNADPEWWVTAKATLRAATAELRQLATDPLAGRVAAHFAVLMSAEALLSDFGIGYADGRTMRALFADRQGREQVQPLAERALDAVRGWVASERDSFPELGIDANGNDEARRGTGRSVYGFQRGTMLYLIPQSFQAWCRAQRLNQREVLREWKRRGWLQAGLEHLTRTVRLDANTTLRLYILETGGAQ